jgi:transposase
MSLLDATTVKRLKAEQKKAKDRRVYIKVTVLLMLHKDYAIEDIVEILGIDESTVYRYRQAFWSIGLEGYLSTAFLPYSGRLSDEAEALLKEELRANLYISSQEVADYIKRTFGIQYSNSAVVKLLNRLGFSYKKTKSVPSKACAEEQAAFLKELEDVLAQNTDNQVVYFNDAVHPQHNTRADYGWIYQGEDFEMPANSSRYRLNLNGALNAHDVTDVEIIEAERVNAQACIELWSKQARKHPGKTIINICDNAAYYHSKVLKNWLEQNPWCKVIYLPPYAPNLNLIERLWKFLRKHVISYYYYEHFEEFRRAVLGFFKNIKEHKVALEKLLTLKFHVIGV